MSNPRPPSSKSGKLFTANPIVLFFAVILIATFFVTLISLPLSASFLGAIDRYTAKIFASALTLAGFDIAVKSTSLTINFHNEIKTIIIGYGCDGVLAYLILTSAIIPFPCRLSYKLLGLIGGLLFMFLINQVRLFGLTAVLFLIKDQSDFGFYHMGVGQVFAIVMIYCFWSYWVSKIISSERQVKAGNVIAGHES